MSRNNKKNQTDLPDDYGGEGADDVGEKIPGVTDRSFSQCVAK
jgi:hypothetical protein